MLSYWTVKVMWVKPANSAQHTVGLQQIHVTLFKLHEPRLSKASCQESDPTLTTYQVLELGTLTSMCLDLLSVKWGSNSPSLTGWWCRFPEMRMWRAGEQRDPQEAPVVMVSFTLVACHRCSRAFQPLPSSHLQISAGCLRAPPGVCKRPHGFLWVCPALLLRLSPGPTHVVQGP